MPLWLNDEGVSQPTTAVAGYRSARRIKVAAKERHTLKCMRSRRGEIHDRPERMCRLRSCQCTTCAQVSRRDQQQKKKKKKYSETDIRATAIVVQRRVPNRAIRNGNDQQTATVCSARHAKRNSRDERQAGQKHGLTAELPFASQPSSHPCPAAHRADRVREEVRNRFQQVSVFGSCHLL